MVFEALAAGVRHAESISPVAIRTVEIVSRVISGAGGIPAIIAQPPGSRRLDRFRPFDRLLGLLFGRLRPPLQFRYFFGKPFLPFLKVRLCPRQLALLFVFLLRAFDGLLVGAFHCLQE